MDTNGRNRKDLHWLHIQARTAAITLFVFSMITFLAYIILFSDERSVKVFISFLVGSILGIIATNRNTPNLFRVAPLIRRGPLKISVDSGQKIINRYWQKFPQYLFWLTNLIYLLALIVIVLVNPNEISGLYYVATGVLGGFATSVALCHGVFFAYVYLNWSEDN